MSLSMWAKARALSLGDDPDSGRCRCIACGSDPCRGAGGDSCPAELLPLCVLEVLRVRAATPAPISLARDSDEADDGAEGVRVP